MSTTLRTIRGIHDALPPEVQIWRQIEQVARDCFASYGFNEVRLPILEPTQLFVRSIGEETDIVSKEMYRFIDQGDDDICLRPEGTAGAVRAYLQAGLTRSGVQRWYYIGPMFRRERPQKGRLRQFQQIGVELFGASGPIEDVELLVMADNLLTRLGIRGLKMQINSLGCPSCRPAYRASLLAFLRERVANLCPTCVTRLESNPMRVLDCKEPTCQSQLTGVPEMVGALCGGCESHFAGVQSGLTTLGIGFEVNPRIVRGLDYYSRTAFEITSDQLGSQATVLAGGRYDGLISELGGPATAAVGFALGLERLAMLVAQPEATRPDVALVAIGPECEAAGLKAAAHLRDAGLSVVHCGSGSAKALFKRAERENSRYLLIIDRAELEAGVVRLKSVSDGSQWRGKLEKLIIKNEQLTIGDQENATSDS